MASQTPSDDPRVIVVKHPSGNYGWRKVNPEGETVASDHGEWSLPAAVFAALEANPEVSEVSVQRPEYG